MDVDVSQFGAFRFNEVSRFNEMVSYTASAAAFVEGVFGMDVLVYEPHTTMLLARYGSDQDENAIESAQFEFIEGGCGTFVIKLNEKPENLNIHRGDRIDIHLMRTVRPWFSGRVTQIPGVNTQGIFEVRGHGYAELLDDIRVDETYQDQPVEKIVIDLADTYLGKRDIGFFSDRFMSIGYSVKHLQFDRITLKEALKKLADLAHHYVFGVDEEREFFFRPIEGRPLSRYANKASHWVGYHLEGFELKEKTEKIINLLYVKIGSIQADDSNFADFIKEDLDSIAFFGERAKVVSAPEIKDEDDAGLWAEYQLEVSAWPEITGRAKGLHLEDWVTSRADLLRAEGFMRVSLPQEGLVAPYYEPLNGYYRYEDLGTSDLYGVNWLKRNFTCRRGGNLGRLSLLLKRHGSPGDLEIIVKQGSTTIDILRIEQEDIADWFTWLSIDLGGGRRYMDLTDFTEVDPAADLTVVANKITFTGLMRNVTAYVAYDFGADYFKGDFEHTIKVNIASGGAFFIACVWALANDTNDMNTIRLASGDAFWCRAYYIGAAEWQIAISECDGGTLYRAALNGMAYNTDYWIKIVRDESVGTYGTLYMHVYTDEAMTTLISTKTVTLHSSKKDFRYLYGISSWNSGGGAVVTGIVENLQIDRWLTDTIVRKDMEYSLQVLAPDGGPPPLHPTACCTDPDNDWDVTTGWTAVNATLTSEAGGVTGKRLKIAATAAQGHAKTENISMIAGKLYQLKVSAGADIGDKYRVLLYSNTYGGSAYDSGAGGTAGAGAGNWDTIDESIECPSTQTDWILYTYAFSNTDNAYFDNVSLYDEDPINYYEILYSTHDAAFSGAFYSSPDSGANWSEDTAKGLIFRSYLVHQDEFILAIKKARYKITPNNGISVDVDLGEIDEPLASRVLNLLRDIEAEKLLQQSNVADLV